MANLGLGEQQQKHPTLGSGETRRARALWTSVLCLGGLRQTGPWGIRNAMKIIPPETNNNLIVETKKNVELYFEANPKRNEPEQCTVLRK